MLAHENTEIQAAAADAPDVPPARRELVKKWERRITAALKHKKIENAFKQMRRNQQFAARGATKEWIEGGNYTVPILPRHINQSVAHLYAKNPKAVTKRKPRLMHQLWDGRADSLEAALELAVLGDPDSTALVQEVMAVQQHDLMLDRMGKTLGVLWDHYLGEQSSNYKQQLKAVVRRAKVCKVAYIKLGFQRATEKRPEIAAQIDDVTSKIASIEALRSKVSAGEIEECDARMEELRLLLQDLQAQETLIVREGPVLDFPRATEIIPDPACRHLKTFTGARWVAQMYEMHPDTVIETYGVDIKSSFTPYNQEGEAHVPAESEDTVARVFEVYDKKNQQCFTICEGWPDFLKEPAEPFPRLERFWPWFPVVFNEIESDDELYPGSDVEHAQDIQNEYNRSRQSLREHRIAARPYYVADGRLSEQDRRNLAEHEAHEVIVIPSLGTNDDVSKLLQRGPTAPIDPNLYDTEIHFSDLLRTVGTQEANLGGTSGDTATESSIAENSRSVAHADNVDDLDEVLTDLAREMGHVMLMELSKETVIEIAGEGAVWPEYPQTRAEVDRDIMLEVEAGSSGRPNQAAELAKLERATPMLVQLQGINPKPIGRRYGQLLDLDVEELLREGAPSITAMNAMMAKMAVAAGQSTGDPATDPNQQGPAGGQNAPGPQQNKEEPGGQPAFPAPAVI